MNEKNYIRHYTIDLPCQLKDTVYVIPNKYNGKKEITPMQCLGFLISVGGSVANLFDDKNKMYQPGFNLFGESVFLSMEQAEEAWNRRKNEQ